MTHDEKELQYFRYMASEEGASFFISVFGLAAIVGFAMTIKYPKAKYMFILPFSAAIECVGYGTRLKSIWSPTLAPFIVSTLFILLAPIILALVNYITVGKLIEPSGKSIACIRPRIISYVFFASDFAGLIIQGIGGSVLASAKTQANFDLGSNIILAGLAFQVAFFTIFTYMMLVAAFGKEFRLYERSDLKVTFNVLISTTILIYIRNIFRFVEYAVPHSSYVPTHEWCFFVFESVPILCVCWAYCFYHFGNIMPDDILDQDHSATNPSSMDKRGVIPVKTSEDLEASRKDGEEEEEGL
jgi:hypothetical protein